MRTSTGANLVSCWFISRSAAKTCIRQSQSKRYPDLISRTKGVYPSPSRFMFGTKRIPSNQAFGTNALNVRTADSRTLQLYNNEFLAGQLQIKAAIRCLP